MSSASIKAEKLNAARALQVEHYLDGPSLDGSSSLYCVIDHAFLFSIRVAPTQETTAKQAHPALTLSPRPSTESFYTAHFNQAFYDRLTAGKPLQPPDILALTHYHNMVMDVMAGRKKALLPKVQTREFYSLVYHLLNPDSKGIVWKESIDRLLTALDLGEHLTEEETIATMPRILRFAHTQFKRDCAKTH